MTTNDKATPRSLILCAIEAQIDDLHRKSESYNERRFYQKLIDDFRANPDPLSDLQEMVGGICCEYREDHWKSLLLDELIRSVNTIDAVTEQRDALLAACNDAQAIIGTMDCESVIVAMDNILRVAIAAIDPCENGGAK